jgi:hypothetical protein
MLWDVNLKSLFLKTTNCASKSGLHATWFLLMTTQILSTSFKFCLNDLLASWRYNLLNEKNIPSNKNNKGRLSNNKLKPKNQCRICKTTKTEMSAFMTPLSNKCPGSLNLEHKLRNEPQKAV